APQRQQYAGAGREGEARDAGGDVRAAGRRVAPGTARARAGPPPRRPARDAPRMDRAGAAARLTGSPPRPVTLRALALRLLPPPDSVLNHLVTRLPYASWRM